MNRTAQILLLSLSATVLGLATMSLSGPGAQKESMPPTPAGVYSIDSVHSAVLFKIKHLNASWSFGRFNTISGAIDVDEKNPEKSTVTLSIEADSVDTANKKRDDHLKSADFLDAVQFPTASFVSTSVKKAGDGKYSVTGDFELHGVTKTITVEFASVGFSETKMGARTGFYGTFTILRSDYKIATMPEALGDEVEITVSLEGRQTESKR